MPRLTANLVPMKWGGYMRSLRGKLKSAGCDSCLGLLRAQAAQAACPDTMQGRRGRLVAIGPRALMTDPDGMIWVTVDANCRVLVLDPATWEIVHTIHLGVPGHFLAATSDGSTVYFSAKEYPFICEVDVNSKEMRAKFPLPVGAQAIRVSHDNQRRYVGHLNRPLLHVIDRAARQVVETVRLTAVPGWPFVAQDGSLVLVTTYDERAGQGFVDLLDASDLTRRTTVDVPDGPFHALPMHDWEHVLVALASGEIVKINLDRAELVPGGFQAAGEMPEMLLHMSD